MPYAFYKVSVIVAFIPLAVSLIVFPFLPEMFPTRSSPSEVWSYKWSANGIFAMFFVPSFSLFFFQIFRWLAPIMYEVGMNNGKPLTPKQWGAIVMFMLGTFMIIHMWYIGSVLSKI